MFIAICYATLYNLIELIHPGSFHFAEIAKQGHSIVRFHFIYFSFTTLTTVGFGDITVVSRHAMPFVILEEITGIFFMAVLVARLVVGLPWYD